MGLPSEAIQRQLETAHSRRKEAYLAADTNVYMYMYTFSRLAGRPAVCKPGQDPPQLQSSGSQARTHQWLGYAKAKGAQGQAWA